MVTDIAVCCSCVSHLALLLCAVQPNVENGEGIATCVVDFY